MKRRPPVLLVLLLLVAAGVPVLFAMAALGCNATTKSSQNQPNPRDAKQIHYGMSDDELQDTIARNGQNMPLRHWGTVAHDGCEVMLTTGHVAGVSPFSFVFVDERLGAILDASFSGIRPLEDAANAAMAAEKLSIEDFRARCEREIIEYRNAQELNQFNIALAPMLLFDRTNRDARQYADLMARFDATRVRLGMSQPQTDALFGIPIRLTQTADQLVAVYGQEIDLDSFPVPIVSVKFRHDVAVSVQTDYHAPALSEPTFPND